MRIRRGEFSAPICSTAGSEQTAWEVNREVSRASHCCIVARRSRAPTLIPLIPRFMAIEHPSVAPGDWDDTVNLRTDTYDEDHETKAIHLCRFADVTWQNSTVPLEEAVRYWSQQVKAYFDRPDVASLPGGVPGLISTQWNTDLRAPKRSHCIGHCDANVRVHPEEVNPDRDILPPDDGLPKVELTKHDAAEAHIYTGTGKHVATTTQAVFTDLLQQHKATASEPLPWDTASQDTILLFKRNRVKQTDDERQAIDMSPHRWRMCPKLCLASPMPTAQAPKSFVQEFRPPWTETQPSQRTPRTLLRMRRLEPCTMPTHTSGLAQVSFIHHMEKPVLSKRSGGLSPPHTKAHRPSTSGVLACPLRTTPKLMKHERVQVLLHLNHRQHRALVTEPHWYMNMRMKHKMPKTWDDFIIALANDAGLSEYANAAALYGSLTAAAAHDQHDWPLQKVKHLRPHYPLGPPMPIAMTFQSAKHPPHPAARGRRLPEFVMPDQMLADSPLQQFTDKDSHWYTDGSKSRKKALTAAVVKSMNKPDNSDNIRIHFPENSHDLRLHTSVRAEHAALATAVRDAPAGQPVTILTDSLTSKWNIKGMLENPERYRNHKHQLVLSEIAQTLRTKQVSIRKVRAHSGIAGNELADGIAGKRIACGQSRSYDDNSQACRGLAWILYKNESTTRLRRLTTMGCE
jgi:ribonuclease HI